MTTQFVDIHMHIHYCIYSNREKEAYHVHRKMYN